MGWLKAILWLNSKLENCSFIFAPSLSTSSNLKNQSILAIIPEHIDPPYPDVVYLGLQKR